MGYRHYEQTVFLPEESPNAFDLLIGFLYQGVIPPISTPLYLAALCLPSLGVFTFCLFYSCRHSFPVDSISSQQHIPIDIIFISAAQDIRSRIQISFITFPNATQTFSVTLIALVGGCRLLTTTSATSSAAVMPNWCNVCFLLHL
jgi:hypothetical protein